MLTPHVVSPAPLRPFYAALRFLLAMFAGIALFGYGVVDLGRSLQETPSLEVAPQPGSLSSISGTTNSIVFDSSITMSPTELMTFSADTTTFSTSLALDPHRVISTINAKPTVEDCGAGAYLSANASDSGGRIHVGDDHGGRLARGCVLKFGTKWAEPPHCVFSGGGSAVGAGVARIAPSSSIVDYVCTSL